MKILTHSDFFDLDECDCCKPLFKFHDSTRNVFIAKCAYVEKEYDHQARIHLGK